MSVDPRVRFAPGNDGVLLVPVVAQDRLSGEVRMLAWASPEALEQTLATGKATFWSRSRKALWTKGETSGNVLAVHDVLLDCDGDALIYLVTAAGPTCHTGAPTCFFQRLGTDGDAPAPTAIARLDAVLLARRAATAGASYTKSLYDGGPSKIGAKITEEAAELAEAVASEADERVVSEAADVLFHTMVALRSRGLGIEAVFAELERRAGTSGHAEKAARFLGDTRKRP